MSVVIFITDIGWAAVSAQLLEQAVLYLVGAAIYLSGLCFSSVSKTITATGFGAYLLFTVFFSALLAGGSWLVVRILGDGVPTWLAYLSFMVWVSGIVYCARDFRGKVLLAYMCAWQDGFYEASLQYPMRERVSLARNMRKLQSK